MKPTLVIMAAGMGSRYGGLKQIDPVGPSGELVIDYSIYDALKGGFGSICFIIRKDIEEVFKESIGKRIEKQAPVSYVFQELNKLPAGFKPPADRTKPWGTGHAILMTADAVKGPFGVINADDFYGAHSYKVLAEYLTGPAMKEKKSYAFVAFQLEKTLSEFGSVTRGVCECTPDGYLKNIVEMLKIVREGNRIVNKDEKGDVELKPDCPASMNMWGFTPDLYQDLESEFVSFLKQNAEAPKAEFLLPTAVGKFIREGRAKVKALRTDATWFGVTYPQDKPDVVAKIKKLIDAKAYPPKLWPS